MLNSPTKQKINNLRDLLVGKIPNPQGQVQQITLALIYKFMSDIDDDNRELFANTTFFPGEFAEYKRTHLMDSKLSAQDRLNLYAEGLEKMNHNPAVPPLFRNIFKQAFLPFRDPQTLDRFLKQIDEFYYEHSEDLGDAFEYLLSCLSAAGDAGQFRTPRHIIDFIVEVVQPAMTDKILDPACGTAGFLISAYKYLLAQHKDLDMAKISQQIVGYDISPEMVQLALVNLYLHQFPDPKIEEYDTLTSDTKRSDKFDCILANPPFMTPKGGISPHNKFSITSNRSEVLFVDYIMEHLKSNGKAGIIVPEGVIFQSANAYKSLRKMLIESGGLRAVVSLPAGVFQPYSGVKTSILLLDKSLTTDHIAFAKITADGYDLGAQRREVSKNDIPTVLEGLLEIKNNLIASESISNDNKSDLIRSVPKADLADDYNLSAERYKTGAIAHAGSWEMVELGEVCEFQNGYAFQSEKYTGSGYQVMRITNVQKGYIDTKDPKYYPVEEVERNLQDFILEQGDMLISLTGNVGRVGILKHEDVPAVLNQRVAKIKVTDKDRVDTRYLYHLMNNEKFENDCIDMSGGVAQKNLGTGSLKTYKIPLPPLEIQEQIVKELDGYQAIIDGARQIISNWKSKIDVQPEWEMVKLGEIGKVCMCKRIFKDETQSNGDIPFYKIGTFGKQPDAYISQEIFDEYSNKFSYPKKGYILISTSGTIGRTVIFDGNPAYFQDSNIVWLDNNESKVLNSYLYIVYQSIDWFSTKGGTIERLYNRDIEEAEISLPPLEIQQSIVARIQHEQLLVDSSKELVQIYEEKVKERVERVRGE